MQIKPLLNFQDISFHWCPQGEDFVLSSSRMLKDARGDVTKAEDLAAEAKIRLSCEPFVENVVTTSPGILEITPSEKWHICLNRKLGTWAVAEKLIPMELETESGRDILPFRIIYAGSKVNRLTLGDRDRELDVMLSQTLMLKDLTGARLSSRIRIFAEKLTDRIIDVYWHERTVSQDQQEAVSCLLMRLEKLNT